MSDKRDEDKLKFVMFKQTPAALLRTAGEMREGNNLFYTPRWNETLIVASLPFVGCGKLSLFMAFRIQVSIFSLCNVLLSIFTLITSPFALTVKVMITSPGGLGCCTRKSRLGLR